MSGPGPERALSVGRWMDGAAHKANARRARQGRSRMFLSPSRPARLSPEGHQLSRTVAQKRKAPATARLLPIFRTKKTPGETEVPPGASLQPNGVA